MSTNTINMTIDVIFQIQLNVTYFYLHRGDYVIVTKRMKYLFLID